MSHEQDTFGTEDAAPGDDHSHVLAGIHRLCPSGWCWLTGLTATSFWVAATHSLWGPGVPIGLCVLADRADGHPSRLLPAHHHRGRTTPTTCSRLAFGVLIVFLVVAGSLWIMANLNHNMLPMADMANMANMQMQH